MRDFVARWSIRSWLVGLAAAVAIPLLLLVMALFYIETMHEEARAREIARQAASGIATRLTTLNTDSLSLLARFALRPRLRNVEGCEPFFALVEYIPQYANLFFYSNDGKLICAGSPSDSDRNATEAAQHWIAAEIRGGRLRAQKPQMMTFADRWVVIIPVAVARQNGTPAGMLVLAEVPEVIGIETLPATTNIAVSDGEKVIVATSKRSQVWTTQTVRSEPVPHVPLHDLEGEIEAIGSDDIPRQYGFTNIPQLGWHVYVGIPTDDVTQHVRRFLWRGLPTGIGITLLIAAMAMFLARRIQRPIDALAHAAGTIGDGSRATVGIDGPREIASLARTFNTMVENRSESDARIRESERNLKALSERLLAIEEEERRRIARELHDDLGQSLTGLKMDVIGLLNAKSGMMANEALRARILRTLDSTVTAVQRIASELRPPMLDDLGLAVAIESEARLFEERTGIECDVSIPAEEQLQMDAACAVAMYRIAQEALTNVSRHADATRVELRIRRRSDELLLEIRDDGRGAADEAIRRPTSLGIIGMRERAAVLGGSVHVEGVDGRGTIVSVRIPAARSAR